MMYTYMEQGREPWTLLPVPPQLALCHPFPVTGLSFPTFPVCTGWGPHSPTWGATEA